MVKIEKPCALDALTAIMARLRTECPWDAEQTHASIRSNMVEEACEAAEAIDLADDTLLCEELGDVLLQVIFHATMAAERSAFTIEDVIAQICNKLIERHPHVFGDIAVDGSDHVLRNWEQIKSDGKGHTTLRDELDSVSKALPGLMRLQKLVKKITKAGMSLPDIDGYQAQLISLAQDANADDVDLETAAADACRTIIQSASADF